MLTSLTIAARSGPVTGAARGPRVDDDLGGGDDAGAELVAQELESPDRLGAARDRRDRTGRHFERRGRRGRSDQHHETRRQERPRAPCQRPGEPLPAALRCPPRAPGRTAEPGEQDGLQGRYAYQRDERHEQPAEAQGADERHRDEQERPQADRDGEPGERDGPARRLHRADDRVVARAPECELRAVPVHDEQRVVDREREPDEDDEVRDVGRHRRHVRKRIDNRQ